MSHGLMQRLSGRQQKDMRAATSTKGMLLATAIFVFWLPMLTLWGSRSRIYSDVKPCRQSQSLVPLGERQPTSLQQQHSTPQEASGPVPFFMYSDPVMSMDSLDTCPGWSAEELDDAGGDLALINLLQRHPWRVDDPHQAKVFIIPIPVASSMLYGDRECGGTHVGRISRAFKRLYAHPYYQAYNASHYLHCQHWRCFLAWRWPSEDIFPLQLFNEGNLSNIMMGRYERHYTTQSDCERFSSTFDMCHNKLGRLQRRFPISGQYHRRWELSRCAIVVPYQAHAALPMLQPSFADWSKRKNTVFYHTRNEEFAWKATAIRHVPINGSFSTLPGVQVGFGLPHEEWVSEFAQSKFCLVIRGDTPSSHSLYNAIKVGCIPVIISGTFSLFGQPFSTQLPWSLFTINFPEDVFLADPKSIARFLWQLPDSYLQSLLSNLHSIGQRGLLYEQHGTLADHILRQLKLECID